MNQLKAKKQFSLTKITTQSNSTEAYTVSTEIELVVLTVLETH